MKTKINQKYGIEYVKFGKGEKNIVFFHGGALRFYSYYPLLKKLANECTVYAVNLPGHGETKLVSTMDEAGKLLSDFINHLSLENVILVGHSFGGACALYTAQHLSNISHLILVDAAGIPLKKSSAKLIFDFTVTQNINGFLVHKFRFLPYAWRALADIVTNLINLKTNVIQLIRLLIHACYAPLDLDVHNFPEKMLILWGKKDMLIPFDNARILQESFPQSKRMRKKGTHNWFGVDTQEAFTEIMNFIQ